MSTWRNNPKKKSILSVFYPKAAGRFIIFGTDKPVISTGLPVGTGFRPWQIWNFHLDWFSTDITEIRKNRWDRY
jgi:hypothetical protein